MKVNLVSAASCLLLLLWETTGSAAVKVTNRSDAPTREFVLAENNADDNFFVTPGGLRDPRITGSNRWTSKQSTGSGTRTQRSLGYIDNGYNTTANNGRMVDIWLENSTISHPLLGLRCISSSSGCNLETSLILPQTTDEKGFYGVRVPATGMDMHGMMSDMFYLYMQQMPLGSTLRYQMHNCKTTVAYDATKGGRCINQASGDWEIRNISHTKAGHLKLINTQALTEVFINSDGIPTIGGGNGQCRMQTIGNRNGISCKMVNYTLQHNGLSNTGITISPFVTHEALDARLNRRDMQFSLDGSRWAYLNSDYNFNELKSSNAIYIFFSSDFFKEMVNLGITDINTKDLFNFRMNNSRTPQSGWYEFSTSNTLMIKPRDFGVSIMSDEEVLNPTRKGDVGRLEPSLDFGYTITTSGRTAADEVQVKVKGPSQVIDGQSYCIFSSPDDVTRVPFPARLTFSTRTGAKESYETGCDDKWHDITHALWSSTPWNDASGAVGTMDKTRVMFSILMNNQNSTRTVDNKNWYGEVSASGEIHVQATWRNVQ